MSALASLIKGWCPGALTPMPTGDGLLARIRLSGVALRPDAATEIADCAARFGNGTIEISPRANVQLRGVREAALPALRDRLEALELLSEEGGANFVIGPLTDIDPEALIDAGQLKTALALEVGARDLPPKFTFLIDDGGSLPPGGTQADISLAARREAGCTRIAIRLGGEDSLVADIAPEEAPAAVLALTRTFAQGAVDVASDPPRRMSALVALRGARWIFDAAGLEPRLEASVPRRAARRDYLGVGRVGAGFFVGAAPPLGRIGADALSGFARAAGALGARDIRFTPWRSLLVTGLETGAADNLAAALTGMGFIVDPRDPRLRIVACAGAPACANAARAVQIEALGFVGAQAEDEDSVIHVSGCAKGCAHPGAAAFTLLARPGGYDLILDGRVTDAPARVGLSPVEAAQALRACRKGEAA